jgi:hypothetical protein
MVVYVLSLTSDWQVCIMRSVQEWRSPVSVASYGASSVLAINSHGQGVNAYEYTTSADRLEVV